MATESFLPHFPISLSVRTAKFYSLHSLVALSSTQRGSRAKGRARCSSMESISEVPSTGLKPESLPPRSLFERISLVLSQWNGLQMAVQKQWGGRDSLQKSQRLASDVLSWFSQSKAPSDVEDLESFLHESLLFSFNTEIEDGSIEEVADQLMIIYEEHMHGAH